MGGCCCSSRRVDSNRTPLCIYCPQALEEHEPLSSTRITSSAVPTGLVVDTNLETSHPNTCRVPPAPLPHDVGMACSQTLSGSFQNCGDKTDHIQSADSRQMGGADGTFESSDICGALGKSDCKTKTDCGLHSPKLMEDEASKLNEPIASAMDEEDVCPTCLEEYDEENPRIITKCDHHFHLSCILEWMERSDTCPICDQIMMIDHASNGQLRMPLE